MGKRRFWAVKVGRVPGIYQTLGECNAQVHKYKNNCYKSFSTLSEAQKFIGDAAEAEAEAEQSTEVAGCFQPQGAKGPTWAQNWNLKAGGGGFTKTARQRGQLDFGDKETSEDDPFAETMDLDKFHTKSPPLFLRDASRQPSHEQPLALKRKTPDMSDAMRLSTEDQRCHKKKAEYPLEVLVERVEKLESAVTALHKPAPAQNTGPEYLRVLIQCGVKPAKALQLVVAASTAPPVPLVPNP